PSRKGRSWSAAAAAWCARSVSAPAPRSRRCSAAGSSSSFASSPAPDGAVTRPCSSVWASESRKRVWIAVYDREHRRANMENVTSVLIVDDHPSFRASARALLEAEGFDVIGEAADGESALQACCDLHPDVVLLDVQLPDRTGFEVASQLTRNGSTANVVLV